MVWAVGAVFVALVAIVGWWWTGRRPDDPDRGSVSEQWIREYRGKQDGKF